MGKSHCLCGEYLSALSMEIYLKFKFGLRRRCTRDRSRANSSACVYSKEFNVLLVQGRESTTGSRGFSPLGRSSDQSDRTLSYTDPTDLQKHFVDGALVCVEPDTLATTYVYDVHSPYIGGPGDITFASNEDFSEEALEDSVTPLATPALVLIPHPWSSGSVDPLRDKEVKEIEVLELLVNRWQVAGFYERAQIAQKITEAVFNHRYPDIPPHEPGKSSPITYPESSWIEFDEDFLDFEGSTTELTTSKQHECEIPEPGCPFEDLLSRRKEPLQVEELLCEMLNECIEVLPLSALPLQAPEFDPDFIASLHLPVIRRLVGSGRTEQILPAMDDVSEVLNDYTERIWSYRPLPTVCHDFQILERNSLCPPPYPSACPPVPSIVSTDAPPPFPEQITEVTDLIRMAATLLHTEMQTAFTIGQGQDIPDTFDDPTRYHLEKLERLVSSCLEVLSQDAIEAFETVLKDGLVLNKFAEHLIVPIGDKSSSKVPKQDNPQSFIQVYEALDLPNMDTLKDLQIEEVRLEDLAAYARAIIQVHGRFGKTASYSHPRSPNILHITRSIASLAGEVARLTGEGDMGSVGSASSCAAGLSTYQLPHDEATLYHQLLSVIRDEDQLNRLLCGDDITQNAPEIQGIVDLAQHLLTFPQMFGTARSELLGVLIRFSTTTSLYPRTFKLIHDPQVDKEPITCGYFGDILRGYVQEQCVCVKVVRPYRRGLKSSKFLKSFMREIVVWGQLHHPNILPFYGVYHLDNADEKICLVSPWMDNGTLMDYLKSCSPDVNRLLLVRDVALGLEYLHDRMIIHGDLKGINILVTLCGRACLADFGLSSVNDADIVLCATLESTGHQGATPRYEAPELLDDCEDKLHRTTSSDMYAFGGVCYEIFTGNVPFYETTAPYAVMAKVIKGETPTKPNISTTVEIPDEVWTLMCSCWKWCPSDRPSASDVLSMALLEGLIDSRPEEQHIWSSSRYRSALAHSASQMDMKKARGVKCSNSPGLISNAGKTKKNFLREALEMPGF